MKTTDKNKIEKAKKLKEIIDLRRSLESQESELKDYFKEEIKDGILEAGSIVITIEEKTRESLDRPLLETRYGDLSSFIKTTNYKQVSVQERK